MWLGLADQLLEKITDRLEGLDFMNEGQYILMASTVEKGQNLYLFSNAFHCGMYVVVSWTYP